MDRVKVLLSLVPKMENSAVMSTGLDIAQRVDMGAPLGPSVQYCSKILPKRMVTNPYTETSVR